MVFIYFRSLIITKILIWEVNDLYDDRESNKIAWGRFVEYVMDKDDFSCK